MGIKEKNGVFEETLKYFKGDSLATDVWMNKYALKTDSGYLESNPDEMHRRISKEFARIESKYKNPLSEQEIYELLKDFKYIIPAGSPMSGIGNNEQIVSLSNCFVIGNTTQSDSYGGILKIDEEQVQLMKRRGGVGTDLSHIRPNGTPVKNSALTSTGIVPFMERYSNTTKEVAQGGRRGALMLSLSVKHIDIESFMDSKLEQGKITGANISVKITDEFMYCVKNNKPFLQTYPIDLDLKLEDIDPNYEIGKLYNGVQKGTYYRVADAKLIWNKIILNAWKSAEPGVLFWDKIINESVPDCYSEDGFQTTSTNPCGEIPLCPYDSCRLLSLNLYSYVKNPFTKNAEFDFDLFKSHVKIAQKLMDDLIDLELEKIDKILEKISSDPEPYNIKRTETELWENIRDKTILGRRTGLGVTAEGDMLAAMGLTYGSDESIIFSTKIHQLHALSAYESSVDMAIDRGKFPIYNAKQEEKSGFIQRIKENDIDLYNRMIKHGRRNISLLTIAPNGSVSICTQTTSGIEPVFQISYKRRRKINPNDPKTIVAFIDSEGQEWVEYNVLHHKFITWLEVNGYNIDNVINEYSDEQLNDLIKLSPYYKSTSNDIDWVQKVKLQSNIQKWVDHSISVTVNIPKETSQEIVSEIYNTAWESGCKGMTIYRDGSRDGVLVTKNDNKKVGFQENNAPKRPKKLEANVLRFQNGKEKWVAVIGLLEGRPYEIFTGRSEAFLIPQNIEKGWVVRVKEDETKKARYDFIFNDIDGYNVTIEGLSRIFNKEYWNYAKLISGILRHGMPLPSVINLISNLTFDNDTITTWKNGVIRAIKKFIKDDTQIKGELCPNCGAETLVFIDGCKSCSSCGWSKCG